MMVWDIGERKERETKWGNPSRTDICFCLLYTLGPFCPCMPPPASHDGGWSPPCCMALGHPPALASDYTETRTRQLTGCSWQRGLSLRGGDRGTVPQPPARGLPSAGCSRVGLGWAPSHSGDPGSGVSGRQPDPGISLVATRPPCCGVYEDVNSKLPTRTLGGHFPGHTWTSLGRS